MRKLISAVEFILLRLSKRNGNWQMIAYAISRQVSRVTLIIVFLFVKLIMYNRFIIYFRGWLYCPYYNMHDKGIEYKSLSLDF